MSSAATDRVTIDRRCAGLGSVELRDVLIQRLRA
jgi:hypothetical protein